MLPADITSNSSDDSQGHLELGPLILEQKATHAIAWLFTGLGVLLLLLGILLCFVMRPGQRNAGLSEMILGGIFVLCSLACLVLGLFKRWRDRGFALFLHTGGIREHRAWGDTVVLFRDAEELRFQATRVFVHGAYAGTLEHLAVRTADPESRMLYFQRKIQEPDQGKGPAIASEVDQVAMLVANTIAGKLTARLEKQETLAWTPRMKINLRGLEIQPQQWWESDLRDMAKSIVGWFRWAEGSRGHWPHLAWSKIDGMTIETGIFRLWAKGEPRPRIQIMTGVENFHAGYIVASRLWSQARSRRVTEDAGRR